ncbi:MAG: peptidoglycan-binding domain-containing protein, partial [Chloroflexota bacterium]
MASAASVHARRRLPLAGAPRTAASRPTRAPGGDLAGALAAAGDAGGRIALMREINGTAGNGAAAALARSLQRQDDDEAGRPDDPDDDNAPFATKDRPFELSNARFTPHKRLVGIADRGDPLARSDPAAAVKAVQTALLDTGYSLLRYHDDGSFGSETADAIRQFRVDNGLASDGGMDWEALRALDGAAPAPGVKQEHYLDYERLFGDGKLDVMLAIGYDEGQSQYDDLDRARTWLTTNKLMPDA